MSKELKEVLERIESKLDDLDKRISALERGQPSKRTKKKTGEVKTSKFTMNVNRARKGVGIAIRFEKFVKVENNVAYVVLNEDEARNFIKSLYREITNVLNGANGMNGKTSKNTEKKASYRKKTSVKIVEE
ncbi:MAG: hypothetical protein DRN30_05490 [Thermoplasmata archaeon]|nr:MAG: hypothetical protein DRN30_05490 [Thermoplasmata archaeon]